MFISLLLHFPFLSRRLTDELLSAWVVVTCSVGRHRMPGLTSDPRVSEPWNISTVGIRETRRSFPFF